ncbi:MAG: sugar phosphate isomerase/epimerase family protein [Tropicimonas sp.]|uniref:sugar phosphate isomerase/epimerase family protein n=1 Tax=Tropicimonas sp. TaxID=2067044 RepID=UPI003A8B71F9
MNKLGLHANVWVGSWSEAEARLAISRTAELGFDVLEMPALDPAIFDIALTRRLLDEAGLASVLSLGLDAGTDISSGDPEKMRAGEARLLDVVSVARDIGAHHISGILYSAFQKYMVPPTRRGIEGAAEVIARVGEKAAASNITLGMEVVNRYETNVLNTAAQAIEFCRMVDRPNVKVHLDVYHMNIEETDSVAAIEMTGDMLGYFHTGDSHRGYLGTGSIDLPAIFKALVRTGYEGTITFESFSSKVVGDPLTGILGIWRNTWDDSDDLVRHAMEYTRSQLKSARESLRTSALMPGQD